MSNQEEKENIVITARTILRIVSALAILAAVIIIISELVSGTLFLDIFTDLRNLPIWMGALSVSLIDLALSKTKNADDEKPQ